MRCVAFIATWLAGCTLMGLYDTPPCPTDTQDCSGECRDLDSDPENCGMCGNQCDVSERCDVICDCRPHLRRCGDAGCVDLMANAQHCGGCNQPCADGLCVGGVCSAGMCPSPGQECAGACVDYASDPLNCGECGVPCRTDQLCLDGTCVDYGPATGWSLVHGAWGAAARSFTDGPLL